MCLSLQEGPGEEKRENKVQESDDDPGPKRKREYPEAKSLKQKGKAEQLSKTRIRQRSQNICYEQVSVASSRFYWSVHKDKKPEEYTGVCVGQKKNVEPESGRNLTEREIWAKQSNMGHLR